MRLIQFMTTDGERRVGAIVNDGDTPFVVRSASHVRDLALEAHRLGRTLNDVISAHGLGEPVDYDALIAERRLLVPLDHPDPYRCVIGITGLTHLGSAQSRDAMHAKLAAVELSDSMKMFKLGLERGRPQPGSIGAQSEWAYKGNGHWCVPPEWPLELPGFAVDGGEEAEIVGLYVIGDHGQVLRVGFALGNEFSDHVMERQNYLYLAHSKLRQCSYGPELLVGELASSVCGKAQILRNREVVWAGEFLSGEDNMCHSIENLEHHHFKYAGFREPGDVHVYFLGASNLSCAEGIVPAPGDVFEISSSHFGRPLRNSLVAGTVEGLVCVEVL